MTALFQAIDFVYNHPNNDGQRFFAVLKSFWWKINQIFFKLPAVVHLTKNTRCIAYPDSSRGSILVYCGFPDREEHHFIKTFIKRGDTCVDVGANIGEYSLLFSEYSINGNIYAFEPVASVTERLQENISINQKNNQIKTFQKVITNKVGSISFTAESQSELSHISTKKTDSTDRVEATTLDQFFTETKLKEIALLKIDVEGAEGLVLSGAKGLIKSAKIKAIMVEVNPRSNTYDDIAPHLDLLKKSKYHFFRYAGNLLQKVSVSEVLSITDTTNMVIIHETTLERITHVVKHQ